MPDNYLQNLSLPNFGMPTLDQGQSSYNLPSFGMPTPDAMTSPSWGQSVGPDIQNILQQIPGVQTNNTLPNFGMPTLDQGQSNVGLPNFGMPTPNATSSPSWGQSVGPDMQNISQEPRQRRSLIDTVGRVSDVLAKVGGAEPLYQSTINADLARAQQLDTNAMRKQLMQQEIQSGPRAQLGQAIAALEGSPDAAALWPQLAQQAGIPPDKAAAIGQLIERNPNVVRPLAAAFGYAPQRQGSLPASVQNYEMFQRILDTQGPAAAEQFRQFAQPSTVLTPYQQQQLALGQQGLASRESMQQQNLASRESMAEAARNLQERLAGQKQEAIITPGRAEADKKFADDYQLFIGAGGYAEAQRAIDQLKRARKILTDVKGATGGPSGYVPKIARSAINQQSVIAQDLVESVVQKNLRAILGGQYAAKEGVAVLERSFNPVLSPKENIKRIDGLIAATEAAAKSKADAARYFETHDTLKGWKGRLPTKADFLNPPTKPARSTKPAAPTTQSAATNGPIIVNW